MSSNNTIIARARALKRLRVRAELSQEAAAEAAGISPNSWGRYERGDRVPDDWSSIVRALGASEEELEFERAAIEGVEPRPLPPPAERASVSERPAEFRFPITGRARAGPAGPQIYDSGSPEDYLDLASFFGSLTQVTRTAGESMTGVVESGALVAYDLDRWPRKGKLCVVRLKDGELLIKLYEGQTGKAVALKEKYPEERAFEVPLSEVQGIYAVRWKEE